jgi:hypothetical protein
MATAIDTSAITGLLVGLSVALTSMGVVNRGPNGRRIAGNHRSST